MAILKKLSFGYFWGLRGFNWYFGPKNRSKINFWPNKNTSSNSPKDTENPPKNLNKPRMGPEMLVAHRRRRHHADAFVLF